MYSLFEFQERAVSQLQEHIIEGLKESSPQTKVLLEAPTGSGKTVMAAALLERLVDTLKMRPGLNDNIAFIWFAPNTLHIQSYDSLNRLYEDNRKINCINLDNLSTDPVLFQNDMLFANWSSLNSETNIWRRDNETNTNLESLIENTRNNGTQIVLLIDEAHSNAFTGAQAIAVRNLIKADVEVLITATPARRPQRSVFVSRKEVINQGLIKRAVRLNIGLNPEEQNGEHVHNHLLRKAFEKKRELQKYYDEELGEGVINPLILIQLPSDNVTMSDEDKSIRERVEQLLEVDFDVTYNNGRLAVWLSGEKDKDGLEDMNGHQDVLIFKQAIAQGWDCPRAHILVSYRDVRSEAFGIQTVGRILRMPHRRHYINDDLNFGYVYTNIESTSINFVPQDVDYFDKLISRRQDKKGWKFDALKSSIIVNDRHTTGVLSSAFKDHYNNLMILKYGLRAIPHADLFSGIDYNSDTIKEAWEFNLNKLIERGWTFEVDDHDITIPGDIEVDPYQEYSLQVTNTLEFARTNDQYRQAFDRFCYDNITRLNREKSWKVLRSTLLGFAELFLGKFEIDARKIFMVPQNKHFVVDDIKKALEEFDIWQRAYENDLRKVKKINWVIPIERYYSENYKREELESHALFPFYEQPSVSNPEKDFKNFLIANEAKIEYWYKNGDKGREHYAVDYVDYNGVKRLFYVDFIIKMKDGRIGLFDTKTVKSDINAGNKHNAIRKMIVENSEKFFGGVVVPQSMSGITKFYYSEFNLEENKFIENTVGFTDLTL
jgi:type III restriction enzyme